MMSRAALWIAQRIVRAAAWLVPAAARTDWTSEWDAELRHRFIHSHRGPQTMWRSDVDLVRRALGALPDAAWIRRQFTLDADVVHDVAHGIRVLCRTPGFTAITVMVFAMGIGAATAIVSVADALFLRPIAVPQPERAMTIWQFNRETGADRLDVAPGNMIAWLQRARGFDAIAGAEPFTFNLNFAGREPDYLPAARVTEHFFTVLGTPMVYGRAFSPQEYQRGAGRVVIISHRLWTTRFGSDPQFVGSRVRLDEGDAYTVVGVMAPGLELRLFNDRGRRPEPLLWTPKQGFDPFESNLRGQGFWNVLGRLRAGVSIEEAQAEFDAISLQLAREYPQTNANVGAEVVPLRLHLVGSLRNVLPLLVGAAVILLIVACANVANLLLARGSVRAREFAVRQALGASRARLIRQMLVETLLLASIGGALGLVLARWTLDTIALLRPLDIALVDRIPVDLRAAVIACGVTIVAALVAGLAPSIQISRAAGSAALRDTRTGPRRRTRSVLVIGEVAAALVLAVGSGLLLRSFMLIQRVDPGFRRDDVSVVQVFLSRRVDTPPKRIVFFHQALERIRALPGVVAAGGVTSMPFGEARVIARGPLAVAGRPVIAGDEALVYTTAVTGDYFHAMNVPLLKGRAFEAADIAAGPQVALVSQSAARRFWPNADPVGSKVRFRFNATAYDAEVVGVIGDVRHEALNAAPAAEVFVPYSQCAFYGLSLVVRTAPGSPANLQALKEQIWAIDPLQSIFHAATLPQLISKTLVGQRFNLFVIGGFALATLLLATAGVYGVMSFSTSRRTREFGIRVALGAQRADIVRLVVGEGMTLACIGVVIGFMAAVPLARLLRALLFGVAVTDPITFVVVAISVLLIAAAACYVPASRALEADPAETLRFDT